jgi:hypothetical protein
MTERNILQINDYIECSPFRNQSDKQTLSVGKSQRETCVLNNTKGKLKMKQGSQSGNKPASTPKNDHSKGSKTSAGKGSSSSSSTAGKRGNEDEDEAESGRM